MEFPKMTAICVCGGCGRTVEKDYVFCPWCGRARIADEVGQETNDFEMNENLFLEKRKENFDCLEEKLNALQKELEVFVLNALIA